MNKNTAEELYLKYLPDTSSPKYVSLFAKRNQFNQEEALQIMLANPGFLDPLLFILFTSDTDLESIMTYEEYAQALFEIAEEQNNTALQKLSAAALIYNDMLV